MKLEGDWITRPATQAVFDALGGPAWFVGGCVRNALLGEPVDDIDIATAIRPEEVARRVGAAGLKPVPTGLDHGTVTVVSDGIPHEVTTFRRDVATDHAFGGLAVVARDEVDVERSRREAVPFRRIPGDRPGRGGAAVEAVGHREHLRPACHHASHAQCVLVGFGAGIDEEHT